MASLQWCIQGQGVAGARNSLWAERWYAVNSHPAPQRHRHDQCLTTCSPPFVVGHVSRLPCPDRPSTHAGCDIPACTNSSRACSPRRRRRRSQLWLTATRENNSTCRYTQHTGGMPGDFGARSICVFSIMYSPQQMDEVFRDVLSSCFALPCFLDTRVVSHVIAHFAHHAISY